MTRGRIDAGLAAWMVLPPLFWAGNAVVGRYAAPLIDPLQLNLVRWLGAGLLLAPLGWRVFATAASRQRIQRHLGHLALLGLLGVGAFNALQYSALTTTSAINATLILSSGPVWSLATGALFFGQRIRWPEVGGAALCLGGVALVISGGDLGRLAELHFVPGDLLLLAATLGWSFYSWMLARPPAGLHPTDGSGWNWAEALLLQIAFGAGWAFVAAAIHAAAAGAGWVGAPRPPEWGWPLAVALAYVMVFPSLLAYRAWGLGVQKAGPVLATFFATLTPVFAALMSTGLLGEAPRWHHAVAFACILCGIGAGVWAKSR